MLVASPPGGLNERHQHSGPTTAKAPFVALATHQILDVDLEGAGRRLWIWGRSGSVNPLPHSESWMPMKLRFLPPPRTAAACLSPWQPGQKTNLLGSKLESYLGARS